MVSCVNNFTTYTLKNMIKQLIYLFVGFSLFTSSIKAQHTHTEATSKHESTQQIASNQAPEAFSTILTEVYKSSQQLNEALISSDAKKAQQAVPAIKKALTEVDMNLLKGKAHTDWMNYLQTMNTSLEKISGEDKIKNQRKQFATFNEALYKSLKTFGIAGEQAYYQYCPMALEGEGAYWLSNTKQIRNPYQGEKMLTCGSTKEVLK